MTLSDVSEHLCTRCGVTAPVALWVSAGMEFSWHGDKWTLRDKDNWLGEPLTDGQIIEARATTGQTGELALAWLIAERRRRSEIRASIAAQKQAGDDAIHAARIRRQAAEMECLARGVKV